MSDTLKLLGMEMENLLRIRSFRVTMPQDGALIIGGDNEQGKSSGLHGLELALAGGDATQVEAPIHAGKHKATVIARFASATGEEYVVEKTWTRTKDGKTNAKLVIKDATGAQKSAPQTILKAFFDFYSLDPVKFLRLPDADQVKIVMEIAGQDLNAYEAQRAAAYDARRDANREVKRLEAALASAPFDPAIPAQEVSIADLTAELQKRQAHNAQGSRLNAVVADRTRDIKTCEMSLAQAEINRDRIKDQIAELEAKLAEAQARIVSDTARVQMATETRKAAVVALASFKRADEAGIVAQIGQIEETNRAIRNNARHAEIERELQAAEAVATKRQEALDAIDAKIAEAQAAVKERLPIEGLGIADGSLTYNGVPLRQAGRSAGIRVASSIAMAKNRDSRIRLLLIDDGETLSPAHQRQVIEDATAAGFQVLMTMVTGRGEAHVEIVDGVGVME